MNGTFQINAIQDSGPVAIQPLTYGEDNQARRSFNRTVGGQLWEHKEHDFRRYSLPLAFVSSADAFRFNDWWRKGYTVEFTLNTSQANTTIQCHITNSQLPIGSIHRGRRDLFSGALTLEAINADAPTGANP